MIPFDGLEIELALGYNNWVLRNFAEVLELAKLNGRLAELPDDYLQRMEAMNQPLTPDQAAKVGVAFGNQSFQTCPQQPS